MINNIKINKIVWTSFVLRNGNDISCVLVKKNIFGGYTLITSDNVKRKVDNLDFLSTSSVLSSSHHIVVSKTLINNINAGFALKNDMHKKSVAKLNKKHLEIESLKVEHDRTIQKMKEEHDDEKKTQDSSRIAILKNGLSTLGEYTSKIYGFKYVPKIPNELEKKYGIGGGCVREDFSKTDKISWKFSEFLEYLISAIESTDGFVLDTNEKQEFKTIVVRLQKLYSNLMESISDLNSNYSDLLYVQTIMQKSTFTNAFKDFVLFWRASKGSKDLNYYHTTQSLVWEDEYNYVYSSSDLIKQAEKACADLIFSLYGEEEHNEFLNTVSDFISSYENNKSSKGKLL